MIQWETWNRHTYPVWQGWYPLGNGSAKWIRVRVIYGTIPAELSSSFIHWQMAVLSPPNSLKLWPVMLGPSVPVVQLTVLAADSDISVPSIWEKTPPHQTLIAYWLLSSVCSSMSVSLNKLSRGSKTYLSTPVKVLFVYFFLLLSFAGIVLVLIGQNCWSMNINQGVEVKDVIDKPHPQQNALKFKVAWWHSSSWGTFAVRCSNTQWPGVQVSGCHASSHRLALRSWKRDLYD